MTKITVNKAKCIGCGICASISPEVFEMGADGKSAAKNPEAECDELVIGSCPVAAISVQ